MRPYSGLWHCLTQTHPINPTESHISKAVPPVPPLPPLPEYAHLYRCSYRCNAAWNEWSQCSLRGPVLWEHCNECHSVPLSRTEFHSSAGAVPELCRSCAAVHCVFEWGWVWQPFCGISCAQTLKTGDWVDRFRTTVCTTVCTTVWRHRISTFDLLRVLFE